MITALRTAIYVVGASVSGSTGGFYYADPPEDVSFPHTVYYLIDDIYSRQDTQIREDNIPIQFSLFDRRVLPNGNKISSVTLEKVAEELITKFDATNLTITGSTSVDLKRNYTRPAVVTDDGNYWQIIINYTLILNR